MDSTTPTTTADSMPNWQRVLESSKGIIPWLVLAFNLIYGYAVKTSTTERTQQQQLEDHIAVMDMRDKVSKLADDHKTLSDMADRVGKLQADQQAIGAKLDTFMSIYTRPHDSH